MLFWARLKWGRLATNYLSLIFLCVNKMIIQTMINVVVSGYFGHFKERSWTLFLYTQNTPLSEPFYLLLWE